MTSALAGYGLAFSLILAIGAQNAFVLRVGLRRQHVFVICLICALSDALLIAAGVAGFGALTQALPGLEQAMRIFGAGFLLWYGARSFLSAWRGGAALRAEGSDVSLRRLVLTCLALTWLNPHVYLDTVVLIGAVSAKYQNQVAFALGATTASFTFFFALGYGARFLSPLFARPRVWQVLDAAIGALMWIIAASLLRSL